MRIKIICAIVSIGVLMHIVTTTGSTAHASKPVCNCGSASDCPAVPGVLCNGTCVAEPKMIGIRNIP